MFDKTQLEMDTINIFLREGINTDSQEEVLSANFEDVDHLNDMFKSLNFRQQHLRIIPHYKKNQIWSVKNHYIDFEGVLQHSKHDMLVLLISNPEELDSDTTYVRVCPLSPFVEQASHLDQVCDDSSIVGFPFIVETWNEQPILTEILDNYVGVYHLEHECANEVLTKEQSEFREIEISNSRYLNHSISSYINEMERSEIFAFSVDMHFMNKVKTIHMPIQNVQNPKLVSLADHEEYAAAARMQNVVTENDCILVDETELPFKVEIRKKVGEYILTIIPKVEIRLQKDGKDMIGMSNSERIVYNGLKKGLYEISSPLIDKLLTIRLK